jgi:hypothetical protein
VLALSTYGGVCDATALGAATQAGQPAWTTPIAFGAHSTTNTQANWVTFILPSGLWVYTGATTSGCEVTQYAFTSVLGPSSGEDLGFLFEDVGTGHSATSIYCTEPNAVFPYFVAQGFGAKAGSAASLSAPVMLIQNTADHSRFIGLMGLSHLSGSIAFELLNVNYGEVTASGGEGYETAQPCAIVAPMVTEDVHNLNCVHAPSGTSELVISLGSGNPWNTHINGLYIEGPLGTADTTTPAVSITSSNSGNPGPIIEDVDLAEDVASSTRYVVQIGANANATLLGVTNAHEGYLVNDIPRSRTITGSNLAAAASIGYYSSLPTWVNGLNGTTPTAATPAWLQYLGTGADGANLTASGNLSGEKYYTNFTIPFGNTVTVNSNSGLTIHATGTCTIAGTLTSAAQYTAANGVFGGSSGGSGAGTSNGTIGNASYGSFAGTGSTIAGGGSAGALTGGNGGNGNSVAGNFPRMGLATALGGSDGVGAGGSVGLAGANSGGARGNGGAGVVLICGTLTGTDGTNTGIIDAEGGAGSPSAANLTGAGSGGGGAPVILSSQNPVTTWPTVYTGAGAGGQSTVPEAVPLSGNACTGTVPVVTCGVTTGALSGGTIVAAGSGCGSSPAIAWQILGGGGTGGTITPTWSGGALTAATCSGGSGYTASTFTSSGNGGQGGAGWYSEWAAGIQVH